MKIIIVRHADPDYSIDSLTPKGRVEAELLSEKLSKMEIDAFYTSPMGRAKDTAEYTLKKMKRNATECEWLKEFNYRIDKPNRKNSIPWDWFPEDWCANDEFFDKDAWKDAPIFKTNGVSEAYDNVCRELDALLLNYGYKRDGRLYKVLDANEKTVVLFCHFGLECVLLSHLLNVSPMVLWHGTCALPSSVTTLVTEERRRGIAYFRMNGFGDVSHLYAGGEEPSFSARFCETFDNEEQRHD